MYIYDIFFNYFSHAKFQKVIKAIYNCGHTIIRITIICIITISSNTNNWILLIQIINEIFNIINHFYAVLVILEKYCFVYWKKEFMHSQILSKNYFIYIHFETVLHIKKTMFVFRNLK